MPKDTRLCIVDDDHATRVLLTKLLEPVDTDIETYASGVEFLAKFQDERPGCVLLDVRMPGLSGLAVQNELNTRRLRVPIIFLTGCADVRVAVRAMKGGAFDFLQKPARPAELIELVQDALRCAGRRFEHDRARRGFEADVTRLTTRELQVFFQIIRGQPSKLMAYELGISQKTIEIHRSNVLHKMRASSALELVSFALRFPEALQGYAARSYDSPTAQSPERSSILRERMMNGARTARTTVANNGKAVNGTGLKVVHSSLELTRV